MRLTGNTLAFDFETTGLRPFNGDTAFCFVLAEVNTGATEVYNLDTPAGAGGEVLRTVCGDASNTLIAHNAKFELSFLHVMGIVVKAKIEDTMLMHQMLDNLARHGLDFVANLFASTDDIRRWGTLDGEITKANKIYGSYDKIPRDLIHEYVRADGERTALIYATMLPALKRDVSLYENYLMEIDLIKVTVHMEAVGILVDDGKANKLLKFLDTELTSARKQIDAIVKEPINVNSPKQLMHLLYDVYEFPKQFKFDKKESKNKVSVDKSAIEALSVINGHPILDLIIKIRSYEKGSAMVASYLSACDADGILHPNINTNAADTGRETSSKPNMQNVSNDVSFKNRYPIPARCCFRARPGSVIFSIDYKAIEMVLGVQGTKSKRLIDLVASGFDFHSAMAASFFGTDFTNADKDTKYLLRNKAKNGARFPMFYGAGPATVSRGIGLPLDETIVGIEKDKKDFPEIYAFMAECTNFAKKQGYIETYSGRKLRVIPGKEYTATDYKIQGSAAVVLKMAQINLHKWLVREFNNEIRLLLPVHDQFLIEYPRKYFPQRKEILTKIRQIMITIPYITAPLEIEIEMTTTTWDREKEFNLETL